MSRYHREHPDLEPDAAMERLYERADYLRDEMKDRQWEEWRAKRQQTAKQADENKMDARPVEGQKHQA